MNGASDLRIVRAAEQWVVIDKPSGLLSVPGKGEGGRDCAAARVRAMFPSASGPLVAHRLDMDTSGLMIFALDAETQRALSMQFERREVQKRYVALVEGTPPGESGEVHLKQRLDIDNRPMQIIDEAQGKLSITRWKIMTAKPSRTAMEQAASAQKVGRASRPSHGQSQALVDAKAVGQASAPAITRIAFTPITGRTHQLRLAAATPAPLGLGCPIIGDDLYGSGKPEGGRLMLAATYLSFRDPHTGDHIEIEIESPF